MAISISDIWAVWMKGKVVDGNDPAQWRKDECGAWMQYSAYGNRNSQYGWEVDHIVHASRGGSDAISNLRPLQWENNAARSDGRLVCAVTANGSSNQKNVTRVR